MLYTAEIPTRTMTSNFVKTSYLLYLNPEMTASDGIFEKYYQNTGDWEIYMLFPGLQKLCLLTQ